MPPASPPRQILREPSQLLLTDGTYYEIIALLGLGNEGSVYLVQSDEGLRSAKVFKDTREMLLNIQSCKSADLESPLPKILKQDRKTRTVLLEYVEGIPVNSIIRNWGSFQMPEDLALEIEVRYYSQFRPTEVEGNILYSFKDRKFHRIDPG